MSHAAGVLLGIAGLSYLVVRAEGAMATTAFVVYGTALILLYLASTIYHGLPLGPRGIRVLRQIDHSAIYVFIAGTYTPICLISMPAAWGWSIFGVIWGLAVAGVLVRLFVRLPKWLYTSLYVAMGWTALIAIWPLVQTFPWHGLLLLLAGGIVYTLGALVYARDWFDVAPRHIGSHGVWHLFVLTGSLLHYIFLAGYVAG